MDKSGPATIDTMPTGYDNSSAPPMPESAPPQYQANTEDVVAMDFVKGVAGILKVLQIVFSLITFICASVKSWNGIVWVQIISMMTFLLTAILYVLHAFKIPSKFPGKVPFKFIEFCYYKFFTLCYFICGVVCSVYGNQGSGVAAAAFFSFACMLLYGADIYFRYIAWRHSGEGPYFSSMMPSSFPTSSGSAAAATAAAETQY